MTHETSGLSDRKSGDVEQMWHSPHNEEEKSVDSTSLSPPLYQVSM